MGLAGAAAEDADSEYILRICECEIVSGIYHALKTVNLYVFGVL